MERPFSAPTPGTASTCHGVRVFVRVRPLMGEECQTEPVVSILGDAKSVQVKRESGAQSFAFDHAFGTYALQTEVCAEVSGGIVEGVLDGISGCVMAYGQTGAGKTHTMMGADGDIADGIMPHLLTRLYKEAEMRVHETPELEYRILLSYLEVYMDNVYDLLSGSTDHINNRHTTQGSQGAATHVTLVKVREELNIYKAMMVEAPTLAKAKKSLRLGASNRTVAETKCNRKSSRGHSVVVLTVLTFNKATFQQTAAQLCLCDLAGSEIASKTKATGEKLRQAGSINKSLMMLRACIRQLAEQSLHPNRPSFIQFRNSPLTRMLENVLGGTANTVVICCISPSALDTVETISTLNFGSIAGGIRGEVKVTSFTNTEQLLARISQLGRTVDALKGVQHNMLCELETASRRGSLGDFNFGSFLARYTLSNTSGTTPLSSPTVEDESEPSGDEVSDTDEEKRSPTEAAYWKGLAKERSEQLKAVEESKKATEEKHSELLLRIDRTLLAISDSLCCPISQMPFKDPVFIEDGYTYERSIIAECLKQSKTSPLTKIPIKSPPIPNYMMRHLMEDKALLDAVNSLEAEIDKEKDEKTDLAKSLPDWARARRDSPRMLVMLRASSETKTTHGAKPISTV